MRNTILYQPLEDYHRRSNKYLQPQNYGNGSYAWKTLTV